MSSACCYYNYNNFDLNFTDREQPLEYLKNGDWIRLEHVAYVHLKKIRCIRVSYYFLNWKKLYPNVHWSLCQPLFLTLSVYLWSWNVLLRKNQINFFIRTKRNLHSHTEKAPLTTHHNQVTGYGDVSSM